jgi:rhomboid protease GluP
MERLFGHTRFLIIYLLGGLAGSVLSALLGGSDMYSVGASGAIFAILAAEFIYLWHHRQLMGAAGRARRQSLIVLTVITFIGGILSQAPGSELVIDNWGHAGGLVGGLILSWVISPILNLRKHPDHPNELLGEDINPLRKHYWFISIYATVLVVLTFVGVFISKR